MDENVSDECRYRRRDDRERERGMREGGATTVGDTPQIMNQSVSDALETVREDKSVTGGERDRKREDIRECM